MCCSTNNFLLQYGHTQHSEPEEGRNEEASGKLKILQDPITTLPYLKDSVTLQLTELLKKGLQVSGG